MSDNVTTSKKDSPKDSGATSSESSSSASESSTSKSSTSKSGSSSGKSAAARSISHFSSVSTNDYRAGWDNIFNNKRPRRANPKMASRRQELAVTLELRDSDLDEALKSQLEAAFRRKAKAKRLNYDKLAEKTPARWRLVCDFSE